MNDHFKQCISSTTFEFFNNKGPVDMNDVLKQHGNLNTNTRASFLKLHQPLQKSNHRQNAIAYVAPNIWNSLNDYLKGP